MPENINPGIDDKQQEILLKIYSERYDHIRHIQSMRATYFNLYIGVIGISSAAVVNLYAKGSQRPDIAIAIFSGLLWLMSIFSMMRSERWSGHISHDMRSIRQIQNMLSSNYPLVNKIIPFNPTPLKSFEYERPLWNRDRSIETPVSMLGAWLSLLLFGIELFQPWAALLFWMIGGFLTYQLWLGEVRHLQKRHANCCKGDELLQSAES